MLGFFIAKYLYNIWNNNLEDIGGFYLVLTIAELFWEFIALLIFLAK